MGKYFFHQNESGKKFEIENGTTFGRGDKADIVISDDKVSGVHLKIHVNEGQVEVEDLKTSNGTFVNGIEINSNVKTVLNEQDKVVIGKTSFIFSEKVELNSVRKAREIESVDGEINLELNSNGVEIDGDKEFDNLREIDAGDDDIVLEFDNVESIKSGVVDPKKRLVRQIELIQKIKDEIKSSEEKIVLIGELTGDLENFNETNSEILSKEYDLKDAYKKYGQLWEELKERQEVLQRQMKEVSEGIKKISPEMLDYEKLKKLKDNKSQMLSQLKSLKRKNLPQKIKDLESELVDARKERGRIEKEVKKIEETEQKKKLEEKEKLKQEIEMLQKKLEKID